MLVTSHNHLLISATDLDDIERRPGGHSEPLALADREVVDAGMLADDLAAGRDQFAGGVRQRLALLSKISVNEPLVVAARDKADLLRVRLLGDGQPVPVRQFADLRLGHISQGEQRAAELFLCEPEEKICLIFTRICRTLQQPASLSIVVRDTGIVPGRDTLGANLLGNNEQLIKLQVIVAE